MEKMRVLVSLVIFLFVSCSTMKNGIKRNHKKTEKIIASVFEEKGNVFYLTSTYSTFSRVWTYDKEKIEIYRLANGKIYRQDSFDRKENILHYANNLSEGAIFELDGCMELDGDSFGFKINNDSTFFQDDIPINIECFKKGNYHSDFFTEIVRDISGYEMWEVTFRE